MEIICVVEMLKDSERIFFQYIFMENIITVDFLKNWKFIINVKIGE